MEASDRVLKVTQFHYTAWPDHSVPDNVMSIISFICHVRKLFPTSVDQPQPVLVHCSAGIGRSGTFITLDMMMQQMKDKATLSVCQCVRYLRTQRMKMVQTRVCMYIISLSAKHVCMWIISRLNMSSFIMLWVSLWCVGRQRWQPPASEPSLTHKTRSQERQRLRNICR